MRSAAEGGRGVPCRHNGDDGAQIVGLLTWDEIQRALHGYGPYLEPRSANPAERRRRPRPMGLRVGSCWSWRGLEELTDEAHFSALQLCRRALLGLRLNAVSGGPARQRASRLTGEHARLRTAGYQAFSSARLRWQGAQRVGAAAKLALLFTRLEPTDPLRDKRRSWLRAAGNAEGTPQASYPRDAPWHPGRQAQPAAGTRLLRRPSAHSQEAGNKKALRQVRD